MAKRKRNLTQGNDIPSWGTDQWMQHNPQRDIDYLNKAKDYLAGVQKKNFQNIQQYGGAATIGIPYGDPAWTGNETSKYLKLYDYIKTRPNEEESVLKLMNATHKKNRSELKSAGTSLSDMLAGNNNLSSSSLQALGDTISNNNIPGQYLSDEAKRKMEPYTFAIDRMKW